MADVEEVMSEIEWLRSSIQACLTESSKEHLSEIRLPKLEKSHYAKFIYQHKLTSADRVLLILALAYSTSFQLFPELIQSPEDRFAQQAKLKLSLYFNAHEGMHMPTVRTAAKILAGDNELALAEYLVYYELYSPLIREKIVTLTPPTASHKNIPSMLISLDPAYEAHLSRGVEFRLDNVEDFHAKKLETNKKISDLILNDKTQVALMGLVDYLKVGEKTYKNASFAKRINKGFVTMFHGYPGTGKTYTATVIGNELDTPVYYVDTAGLISKYVGETSKNLKNIFDRLQGKNCILFFDEADAVFGKRTIVQDSKDRFGNQEISYLLQAIEKFDGVVILSSNFPDNIDMAFRRRIHLMVNFEPPEEEKRLKLWKHYFPEEGYQCEPANLLEKLAERYSLTGANIANLVKMACTEAVANGNNIVNEEIMDRHISSEYYKDGRNINAPHAFAWEKMKGMG